MNATNLTLWSHARSREAERASQTGALIFANGDVVAVNDGWMALARQNADDSHGAGWLDAVAVEDRADASTFATCGGDGSVAWLIGGRRTVARTVTLDRRSGRTIHVAQFDVARRHRHETVRGRSGTDDLQQRPPCTS